MGPSIEISSISIEIEGSTDNIETCDHFSIRGFVAERRDQERDQRSNCWPFPEGRSMHNRSLSLPDLRLPPRQRRWTCRNCMRDLDPEGTIVLDLIATIRDIEAARTTGTDGGDRTVPSTSSEREIEGNSAVIPTQSTLPAVVVLDSENETEANVAGNNVEEINEVNREKSEKGDDHQKDTMSHPESSAPYNFRSRSRKRACPEQVGNKRSKEEVIKKPSTGITTQKEKQSLDPAAVMTTAISGKGCRAVLQRETGPSESLDPSVSGWQRRKQRKGRKRLVAELLGDSNQIIEQGPASKRQSRRGRKRKVVVAENENANGIVRTPGATTAETDQREEYESTDSGLDRNPIRGKQKNRRFQVSDEPCEASEADLGKSPLSAQPNDKLVDLALQLQDDAAAKCLRDLRSSGTEVDVHISSNNETANASPFPNLKLGHFPSSTDVTLQKDASGASSKGKTIMVQEHHEAPTIRGKDRKETTSDEWEIAELMAINQYERYLADKEEDVNNKQPPQETAPTPKKKALMIDLNETYDNEMSLEDNNTSEPPPPPPPPCDSDARKQDHLPIENQQKSPEVIQVSQPYLPSPFGIFPPTQEIRASSSMGYPGNNGQWLGTVPVMATHSPSPLPVLRGCETCHHGGQHQVVYPLWPPPLAMMAPHACPQMPISYMNQPAVQPQVFPQAPGYRWNPTLVAAATENQKRGPTPADSSLPVMRGRLRDPRLQSQISAEHQRNAMFPKRHFPPVSQGRERLVLQTGESSKTVYPARQSPFLFGGQYASETSRMIPPPGTNSFSYRDAQASWIQQQQRRKDAYVPVYDNQERSVFASGSNNQGSLQLPGASSSVMLPPRSHVAEKEKNQERQAETSNNNASALPPANRSEPMVCVINRNPADFSIAEVGNIYMYVPEDPTVRNTEGLNRRRGIQRARDRDTIPFEIKNKSSRKQ